MVDVPNTIVHIDQTTKILICIEKLMKWNNKQYSLYFWKKNDHGENKWMCVYMEREREGNVSNVEQNPFHFPII